MTTLSSDAGWADLPPELLIDVSKRLDSLSDFLSFRAVCRAWRSAAAPRHLRPLFPWLLLPSPPSTDLRRFFSPSDGRSFDLHLPEARGSVCRGSSHGWLILLRTNPDVLLLNPITRAQLRLPPITSLPHVLGFSGHKYRLCSPFDGKVYDLCSGAMRDLYVSKIVLSSNPAADPNCLAAAVLAFRHKIAVCRVGSHLWSEAAVGKAIGDVCDIAFHGGMFFVLGCSGKVAICDAATQPVTAFVIQTIKVPVLETGKMLLQDDAYLVESGGELLAVVRRKEEGIAYVWDRRFSNYTDRISIYTLKLGRRPKKVKAKSIGARMLFGGEIASLSVSAADFPKWSGDCVYFTDPYECRNEESEEKSHGVCIFHLKDASIDRLSFELGWFQEDLPPPIWFTPSLY